MSGQRLFAIDDDSSPHKINELNLVTGSVIRRFLCTAGSAFGSSGLAFDGQTLYFLSNSNDRLYKLNPNTGAVLDSVALPSDSYGSIAYLGGKIYVFTGSTTDDEVYSFNLTTNTLSFEFRFDDTSQDSLGNSAATGELMFAATTTWALSIPLIASRRTVLS